ncbi:MAG: winged helix-turn-helix domain-containing protein [Alphaproteobacteria bacterium]|nr:winged helix-turn-helix domain-containing protein [Alphaproteobacteria bacterium]
MTIFLSIPDAALHEAVAEQIAAARLGEARAFDGAAGAGIYIFDEAAFDKKTASLFTGADEAFVLLLGGEDEGASESFAKPFRLGHLMARLHYYSETAPLLRGKDVAFGPYRLEPQNRCLTGAALPEPIRLTEKETALLVFLAQHENGVSRRDILAEVWGYDERIDTHTLETHIYQLRRKLEKDGENWLINENGLYRLARGQG